jgi:hypothetical protein
MNNQLNASVFIDSSYTIYNEQFESILENIIVCYNLIIENKVTLLNDENKIRNELVNNYLMDNTIREKINLTDYLFEREVPEKNDLGRVDIKIVSKNTFYNTNAYYIIECKRLDNNNRNGKTGLNGEYISNGIARFVLENKYFTYDNTAGMIGFVVSKMDIRENVGIINKLLKNTFTDISTEKELTPRQIMPDFKCLYYSNHKVGNIVKIIYHLMFDFSENIKKS